MLTKQNIKYIQSLQYKKFRDEHNAFVAEGPKVIAELLDNGSFNCLALYALPEWIEKIDNNHVNALGDRLIAIKSFELEKIAHYSTPNAAVAVFEKKTPAKVSAIRGQITLLLDNIQDPGNMGTIIRTADWFGIKHIVCSENTVDIYNNKVVQSTMASLGRVEVSYTSLFEWLKEHQDAKKIAAVLEGNLLSKANFSEDETLIVMIGNESNGLSDQLIELADEKMTIPSFGQAESLNAAIAAAIFMYALK